MFNFKIGPGSDPELLKVLYRSGITHSTTLLSPASKKILQKDFYEIKL